MELRQLEYFVELGRVRNFTKASENLHVAQPSVTKAVQKLEEELGVRLVDRGQKPLKLTEKGELFYEQISDILERLDQTVKDVSAAEKRKQVISIGVNPMVGVRLKEMLISPEWRNHKLFYNIKERNYKEIFTQLTSGELDLGWVIRQKLPSGLEFIPVEMQEAVLVLPPDSPLQFRESLTFSDLKDQFFSMSFSNTSSVLVQLILKRCREAGFEPRDGIPQYKGLPDMTLAVDFIANSYGMGFMPEYAAAQIRNLPVRSVTPPLTMEVGLVCRRDEYSSGTVRRFISYITKTYPKYLEEYRRKVQKNNENI